MLHNRRDVWFLTNAHAANSFIRDVTCESRLHYLPVEEADREVRREMRVIAEIRRRAVPVYSLNALCRVEVGLYTSTYSHSHSGGSTLTSITMTDNDVIKKSNHNFIQGYFCALTL